MLNLLSILEVVEYLSSKGRVYVFFIRKMFPRKLRLRFLIEKIVYLAFGFTNFAKNLPTR